MSELEQNEAELVVLDGHVDTQRQAVSRLRRQIDAFRPIPMPAVGCGKPLEAAVVQPLRALLYAHSRELTASLARRDAVAAEVDDLKRKLGGRS